MQSEQLPKRNVFAVSNQTTFKVTNNSGGQLGGQSILVYLTPLTNAQNWLYYAWQNLTPGDGGSSSFTLNQNVAVNMLSQNGNDTTNSQTVNPGWVSLLTNSAGLNPTLGAPVLGSTVPAPTVTTTQSGVKNNTANPGSAMYSVWSVNGNQTAQSKQPVSAGGTLSAFELNTTLYWSVGYKQVGPNYTYQQITTFDAYALPAATPTVNVSLGYDKNTQQFTWTFDPPSATS
jgi:hypothetical protein